MKPAAAASFEPLEEYMRELTAEVVNTKPAARKPVILKKISNCSLDGHRSSHTATLYVRSESAATVTVTPMMQKNKYTSAHQA